MFAYEGNIGAGTKAIDYFMDAMRTYEALNAIPSLELESCEEDETRIPRVKEGMSWIMWGLYCAEW